VQSGGCGGWGAGGSGWECARSRVDGAVHHALGQAATLQDASSDLSSNSLMSRCLGRKMPNFLILDSNVDRLSPSLAATLCPPDHPCARNVYEISIAS